MPLSKMPKAFIPVKGLRKRGYSVNVPKIYNGI